MDISIPISCLKISVISVVLQHSEEENSSENVGCFLERGTGKVFDLILL